MTKRCKTCGEERFFDPSAKSCSKASGFWGLMCWPCYLQHRKVLRAKPGQKERAKFLAQYSSL